MRDASKPTGRKERSVVYEWLSNGLSLDDRACVAAVYLISSQRTGLRGTAFLLQSGWIVTAEHVVANSSSQDLILTSIDGSHDLVKEIYSDPVRDVAILRPALYHSGGLKLRDTSSLIAGCELRTWGHPLSYVGPAPLLSVGHLAGFVAEPAAGRSPVRRLVVNGAFNSGNSGGPVIATDGCVIGVVTEKALPQVDKSTRNAIAMLAANPYGEIIERRDEAGNVDEISDSQLLAAVLQEILNSGQVMIGEALAVEELRDFIAETTTQTQRPHAG